jgi:hypothetical protein
MIAAGIIPQPTADCGDDRKAKAPGESPGPLHGVTRS